MSNLSYTEAVKQLSPREVEVLDLTVKGYTRKEIAKELQLSAATVKRHKENIRNKLSLHGRHALVKWYAEQNGIMG
jgi:RNA polymerase sigma factor (sigma-70 family)|tara:strand:- start:313 stop:540 length:228 start_codon:yes stop_codon:yes gene_type:complete